MLFVDHHFFDMFSFEFIAGNPKTALTEINNVVLPKLLLEQYLENPMLSDKFYMHKTCFIIKLAIFKLVPFIHALKPDL